MKYSIHITSAAERDLIQTADYIEYILKNPQAADHLLDEAEKKINTLSEFPEKFQLVNDSVLASWGIRFILVNNYLVFYKISKKNQQVHIVRFLYQKSNWISILRQEELS